MCSHCATRAGRMAHDTLFCIFESMCMCVSNTDFSLLNRREANRLFFYINIIKTYLLLLYNYVNKIQL